jgi:MFS family permease
MYTIGLAHLGSQLSGHELASANAAFVLCYGVGMVLGPQAIGIGMDMFGPSGFGWSLAVFFAVYMVLAAARLAVRRVRS